MPINSFRWKTMYVLNFRLQEMGVGYTPQGV